MEEENKPIYTIFHLLAIFILSYIYVFSIYPFIHDFLKVTLYNWVENNKLIFVLIIVFFIIVFFNIFTKFLAKYFRTFKIKNPPVNVFEYTIFFILFVFNTYKYQSNSFIFFLCLYAAPSLIIIFLWFCFKYSNRIINKDVINKTKYDFSDEPIFEESEDKLERKEFVQNIYNILTLTSVKDSFVIGLYGSWGEGKTSVLNLLRNRFLKNKDFEIFDFNPWLYNKTKNLLNAFYFELEKKINKLFLFSSLSNSLKKFVRQISISSPQSILKLDLLNKNESVFELKKNIETKLYKTNKKYLIIIDDIDRMQEKNILQIFKLIKLNSNLKNIIFLVSFDPIIIQNILKNKLIIEPDYLEKFIQMSIELPKAEETVIKKYLFNEIENVFKEIGVDEDKISKFFMSFNTFYKILLYKYFRTYRHAKRYIFALQTSLPLIHKEIKLFDYFLLEIIRQNYPDIYEDIWKNNWAYIHTEWFDDISRIYDLFGVDNSKKTEAIKNHINDIPLFYKKDENDIKTLLSKLFIQVESIIDEKNIHPIKNEYRMDSSISHPKCFDKYFLFKVPTGKIPDEQFTNIINTWEKVEENEIENLILDSLNLFKKYFQLLEFLTDLYDFSKKLSENTSFHFINTICKNTKILSRNKQEGYHNSEYIQALLLTFYIINGKFDVTNINEKVKIIISNVEDPYWNIQFGIWLNDIIDKKDFDYSTVLNGVKKEEIIEIIFKNINKYLIIDNKNIFEEFPEANEWALILAQYSTEYNTSQNNVSAVQKYVSDYIKINPLLVIKILDGYIDRNPPLTRTYKRIFLIDRLKLIVDINLLIENSKILIKRNNLNEHDKSILKSFLEQTKENK